MIWSSHSGLPQASAGNIDYVNQVTFGDALRMTLGLSMPRRRNR